MVQHQCNDVYLAPFGNPEGRYREYAAPVDSPVYTGDPNEVWIEAVDGERFVIVVDLLNGFDPKGSKALQIHRRVNDGSYSSVQDYPLLRWCVPDGVDLQGRYKRDTEARKVDGRWSNAHMHLGDSTLVYYAPTGHDIPNFFDTD
jgi:hypothetical protein